MLLINPHIFFFGPTQFYEGHLRSHEGLNLSGASPPGFPFPVLGHNAFLGWSHTINIPPIATPFMQTVMGISSTSTMGP
jgi:acyl-homoserine-lactone acylase